MITTETPYKLAEIIRDTWPGLYRPPKDSIYKNKSSVEEIGVYDRALLLERSNI